MRTGVPCCGLSLSRKGQVLSRLNILGIPHAWAEPALEASAKNNAQQTAFMVLQFVFILVPTICRFIACRRAEPLQHRSLPRSRHCCRPKEAQVPAPDTVQAAHYRSTRWRQDYYWPAGSPLVTVEV